MFKKCSQPGLNGEYMCHADVKGYSARDLVRVGSCRAENGTCMLRSDKY